MRKKPTNLTPKQLEFARHYLKTSDPIASYKHAYNVKPGTKSKDISSLAGKLLRNPKIDGYLQRHFSKANKDGIMDAENLLRFWTETIENEDVKLSERIKCSELLAKNYGMLVNKVDANVKQSSNFEITIIGEE